MGKLKNSVGMYAALMNQEAINICEALQEGRELDDDAMAHIRAVHAYCERLLAGEKPLVGFWYDERKSA